jgi:hypothetical protein
MDWTVWINALLGTVYTQYTVHRIPYNTTRITQPPLIFVQLKKLPLMACATIDHRGAAITRGVVILIHGLYGGSAPLLPLRWWIQARTSYEVQPFRYHPRQQVQRVCVILWKLHCTMQLRLTHYSLYIRTLQSRAMVRYLCWSSSWDVPIPTRCVYGIPTRDRAGRIPFATEATHNRR